MSEPIPSIEATPENLSDVRAAIRRLLAIRQHDLARVGHRDGVSVVLVRYDLLYLDIAAIRALRACGSLIRREGRAWVFDLGLGGVGHGDLHR